MKHSRVSNQSACLRSCLAIVALLGVSVGCGKKDEPTAGSGAAAGAPAAAAQLIPPPEAVDEPAPVSPEVPTTPWQTAGADLAPVAVTKADKLQAVKLARPLPGEDPYAPFWKDVGYVDVSVMPQQATAPQLKTATVDTIRVQVAHDGTQLALRLEWADEEPSGLIDTGRFPDAVAVELPLKAGAPPTMGAAGSPVQIIHWKAIWQKDVDTGYQDVQDVHPNVWSDLYWFAEGGHPYSITKSFKKPEALQWMVAMAAGNPMAVLQRTTPAEEAVAEGWGSLTTQPQSATKARGLWNKGRWAVVFTRPLKTDDPNDVQLEPGKATQLAFAIWDGGKGQIGARKHWSGWTDVTVAP